MLAERTPATSHDKPIVGMSNFLKRKECLNFSQNGRPREWGSCRNEPTMHTRFSTAAVSLSIFPRKSKCPPGNCLLPDRHGEQPAAPSFSERRMSNTRDRSPHLEKRAKTRFVAVGRALLHWELVEQASVSVSRPQHFCGHQGHRRRSLFDKSKQF